MVVLSALCVTPLACVLNCLLGGCMHAAQVQAQPATAHIALPVGGTVATTTPATPDTLTPTPAVPRSKHHCCAVKKQERLPQPGVEAPATPATPASVALAAKAISGQSMLRLETSRLTAGNTAALVGADDACCGCHHAETPDRFTVASLFTFEAPLAATTCLPVRLPVVRRPTASQRPVVVAYQPSRRDTYLRCCVFRI
ncbi:hypothetical protein J8C01_12525 [Chloracidobacterium sp. D]|uniref:hypothetical protein n=1 Tax=Chloracidobacterium sp. D TaxID=2821536 RepID=UPI001B8D6EBF|nr:hypothetical protein [Chloracidobacterium sp. D]QUV83494.1 hypothetical protein J8C01_12525 [Chloracidobacterium sp. D]